MQLVHSAPTVRQHFATERSGLLIAAFAIGALFLSANAVAYGEETSAEVLDVFNGCTITPPTNKTPAEIQGTCLGHTFSNSAEGLPLRPWEPKCYASLRASRYWTLYNCRVDGRPAFSITFHRKTKRLREITWITNIDSAGHILTRQEVFERDEEVATAASSAQPINCRPVDSVQSATEPSSSSIYGLTLGERLPCMNNCSDQLAGSKAPMCRASGTSLTRWGTTQFSVRLNADVFDFATRFSTGDPILELLDGKLVGVRFTDINPEFKDAMAAQLSSKFGNFLLKGGTYVWTTPAASARYSVSDHLTTGSLLGALLSGDACSGAGTITIYTPIVQVLVQKYEVEQAKLNKKWGL